MDWLKNLLNSIKGKGATDFLFIPSLDTHGEQATAIVPDECYIELVVDSLRIDKERAFATKFHGVVYTFTSLARFGDETASFAAVTKPDKLSELDKESVGKVLVLSKRMMGPVPWRGGRLEVQLGLFSIKSGNLLTPVLNFVTKVSEAAGLGIGAVVKPFVPLIAEGMDMIAGQTEDTKLVVGIDSGFELGQTMRCAIVATGKTALDVSKITRDAGDGKLLLAGKPLETAYCVFSLRAVAQKADFGEIPELKSAYALFRDSVVKGKEDEAREAFAAFRRLALASPDLISSDAAKLVAKAKALLEAAFGDGDEGSGGVAIKARGGGSVKTAMPETLGDIALYVD